MNELQVAVALRRFRAPGRCAQAACVVRIGSAVDAVRSGSAGKAAAPKVDMLAEAVPAADIQARDGAIPPSGKPVGVCRPSLEQKCKGLRLFQLHSAGLM